MHNMEMIAPAVTKECGYIHSPNINITQRSYNFAYVVSMSMGATGRQVGNLVS